MIKNSRNSNAQLQLAALQEEFKQQLDEKVKTISRLVERAQSDAFVSEDLNELYRLVHGLAGSAGTFGAQEVSTLARELEHIVKAEIESLEDDLFSDSGVKRAYSGIMNKLKEEARRWQPSTSTLELPQKEKTPSRSNIVYLLEDDELLASDLVVKLELANFRVHHFSSAEAFVNAFRERCPSVIIMDVVLEEGDLAGIELVRELKKDKDDFPPIIFISIRDDIEVRLEAARIGAARYLKKPFRVNRLVQTLSDLTGGVAAVRNRVLLIDDDETLVTYHRSILTEGGMEVEVLTNPLQALDKLREFKPDAIVIDVYMPECSGPELAQVIRQDDDWGMTPIIFLSSESNVDRQLEAVSLGGDDFLVKPVEPKRFVAAIKAKAERGRWTTRVTNDLKHALRENKFQLATMDQHDIVSVTDLYGFITSVNDRFCEVSGYSREELIGENHRVVKSDYHPPEFYQDMWRTIARGEVWHGTVCNKRKDGQPYWVESTIVPFLDESGKPYKYVSARTDITALRASEERLRRSQAFAKIGTWDWNIVTGELYWSELIAPLFGYVPGSLETTYDNFLAAVHPEDRQQVIDAVNNCVELGREYKLEHRVVWPDGSVHWLLEEGDVVRNKEGNPLHMLGVVQNIDARKKAEAQLIITKDQAERANKAKSHFLSRMSHELRTPLNAIIGFGQLLSCEPGHSLSDSQLENVDQIERASRHLLELINEVLDLAKIESGRIELTIEPVPIDEVIFETMGLISPIAQKHGITMKVVHRGEEIDVDQLPREFNLVRADRTRFTQVLLNLLSNAAKYNSENGEIIISCDKLENENVRISVTDTGQGLNEDQLSQLFKAFNRFDAENSDIEGTGIGLVICKNIIELMEGSIGAESVPGEGSTFWIELPIVSGGVSVQKKSPSRLEETGPQFADIEPAQQHEHTVLYIEDNPANLRLVMQLLGRRTDIHMWGASDPKQGLELVRQHSPDLILLDINFPGDVSGFDMLKQLRSQENTRHTPVIAISSNAMPTDIEKGLAEGFDAYVTKPLDIKGLLSAVDELLNKRRATD